MKTKRKNTVPQAGTEKKKRKEKGKSESDPNPVTRAATGQGAAIPRSSVIARTGRNLYLTRIQQRLREKSTRFSSFTLPASSGRERNDREARRQSVERARATKEVPARENTSRGECAGRRIAFGERPPGERLLCCLSEATPWGADAKVDSPGVGDGSHGSVPRTRVGFLLCVTSFHDTHSIKRHMFWELVLTLLGPSDDPLYHGARNR